MKQTAVEWLLNNLHEIGVNHNLSIKAEKGWLEKRNEIIEQAKAMEKEQIFDYIKENYVNGENSLKFHQEEFEKYYNNNFGVK